MAQKITIFWHRRDLRVHDNAGLHYAIEEGNQLLPIFIFDSNILNDLQDKDDARLTFIHDNISGIAKKYNENGGRMMVKHGDPIEIIKKIVNEYPVASIYTNRDYEPYAKERDRVVEAFCKQEGVGFYPVKDQVIFEEGEVLNGSDEPYKVFTPYKNKWMEKFNDMKLSDFKVDLSQASYFIDHRAELPALEDLGFRRSSLEIPGKDFPKEVIEHYEENRNFPSQDGTSRLGIHLRHGTISVRDAVRVGHKLSDSWLNELIWREFYMMILAHFPHVVTESFKSKYDKIPWRNNEEDFQKWCEGKTGFPIVDAGMRELNETGYMHNRVRMIVASFLTKHLLIDWRWGEQYFARKLLDYELSSNNGGWQWAAGTGTDAQPYFRVFNPYSQTDKFDKKKEYIKEWIPEYGTDDYPEPMVEHKFARQRALDTYKEALN